MSSTLNEYQQITREIDAFEERMKKLCMEYGLEVNIVIKHVFGDTSEKFTIVGKAYASR